MCVHACVPECVGVVGSGLLLVTLANHSSYSQFLVALDISYQVFPDVYKCFGLYLVPGYFNGGKKNL